MSDEHITRAEDLRRIADITFQNRVSKLYDSVIRETRDIVDKFSNEGIASAGKYQRKVADEVFSKFEMIEQILEQIYVDQLYSKNLSTDQHTSSFHEQWIRNRIIAVIDSEIERAQAATIQLCSSIYGPFANSCQAFTTRINGEGTTMKQRLDNAITARTLATKGTVDTIEVSETNVSAPTAAADGVPTAFISYSWDSGDHQEWVLQLAERLTIDGVKVILDCWHLRPGGDRTFFMESSVRESNYVLVICTPEYAKKANARTGGVGYEAMIITAELARHILKRKFIPVLRRGEWGPTSQPAWIESKLGVDLRGDPYDEKQYQDLLRELHQSPLKPPPVGPKPAFSSLRNPVGTTSSTSGDMGSRASIQSLVVSNLLFIGSRVIPISDSGETWSGEMGPREKDWATAQGQVALVARIANEARQGAQNRGWLVKANLIFRDGGQEIRRIIGSWLDEPTDYVEISVDETRELLLVLVIGQRAHTIGKRRIQVNLNSDEVKTNLEPIPQLKTGTLMVRLTDADTGQFLMEREFRLRLNPLSIEEA